MFTLTKESAIFDFDSPGAGNTITVSKISGWDLPPIRSTEYPKPGGHGGEIYADYLGIRAVTLEGHIISSSTSSLENLLNTIKKYLSPGQVTLTRKVQSKYITAEYADIKLDEAASLTDHIVAYQMQLKCADPRKYSTTLKTQNISLPDISGGRSYPRSYPLSYGTVISGGHATLTNAGNTGSPPIIKIYGPVDNPSIINNTTQKTLAMTISLSADDYLVIDTSKRTVMLNDQASRFNTLTSFGFFDIEPGDNDISFSASLYTAGYAQVSFRDAYL